MRAPPDSRDVRVLLFDLGGVLLELNDPLETFGFETETSAFFDRWIRSPSVRELERGAIDVDRFSKQFVEEASLPYGPEEFLERFSRWPKHLFDGVPALLSELGKHNRLGLLSNTNSLHWNLPGIRDRLEGHFEKILLSYRTGKLKPDSDTFMHAIETFRCEPEWVVFFDDNPANVDAALATGCRAFLVNGRESLEARLAEIGAWA